MIDRAYATTMAAYNGWMNRRLYEACAGLSDAQRRKDVGAFFKSIHGTLNHLLVGDRVWMSRFLRRPVSITALDQELYSDFDALRVGRQETDGEITAWAEGLSESSLRGTLSYTSIVNPAAKTIPFSLAVVHMFNHQTHHRGQVTALLMQAGVDPGITDLIGLPNP